MKAQQAGAIGLIALGVLVAATALLAEPTFFIGLIAGIAAVIGGAVLMLQAAQPRPDTPPEEETPKEEADKQMIEDDTTRPIPMVEDTPKPTPVRVQSKPPKEVIIIKPAEGGDDLTVVEGIGPKINDLLHTVGIKTYQTLSEQSPDQLRHVLDAARFPSSTNPESWPAQAKLAANGQWDALQALKDALHKGRRKSD